MIYFFHRKLRGKKCIQWVKHCIFNYWNKIKPHKKATWQLLWLNLINNLVNFWDGYLQNLPWKSTLLWELKRAGFQAENHMVFEGKRYWQEVVNRAVFLLLSTHPGSCAPAHTSNPFSFCSLELLHSVSSWLFSPQMEKNGEKNTSFIVDYFGR